MLAGAHRGRRRERPPDHRRAHRRRRRSTRSTQLVDGLDHRQRGARHHRRGDRRGPAGRLVDARQPARRGGRRQRPRHRHALDQAALHPSIRRRGITSRIVRSRQRGRVAPARRRARRSVVALARPRARASTARCSTGSAVPASSSAVAAGVPLRRQITGALELAVGRRVPWHSGRPGHRRHARRRHVAARPRPRGHRASCSTPVTTSRATTLMMRASASPSPTRSSPGPCSSLLARLGSTSSATRSCCCCGRATATGPSGASTRRPRTSTGPSSGRHGAAAGAASGRRSRRRGRGLTEGNTRGRRAHRPRRCDELGEGGGPDVRPCPPGPRRVRDGLRRPRGPPARRRELPRRRRGRGRRAGSTPGRGTCRLDLVLGVLVPLGRFDEALAQVSQLLGTARPVRRRALLDALTRGSCCSTPTASTAPRSASSASPTSATCTTTRG